jgi:hypothetical protein
MNASAKAQTMTRIRSKDFATASSPIKFLVGECSGAGATPRRQKFQVAIDSR